VLILTVEDDALQLQRTLAEELNTALRALKLQSKPMQPPSSARGPSLPALVLVAIAAHLTGCATLTESPTQLLEVATLDQRDQPIAGMECKLSNGTSDTTITTPAKQVEVRRSYAPLEIECQRGDLTAKGTVLPKGDSAMLHSFLPGGSLATLIDHATGAMYTYPSPLVLRIGQHLQFEHGGGARASVVGELGTPLVSARPVVPGERARANAPPRSAPTRQAKARARNNTAAAAPPIAAEAGAPHRTAPVTW
jgi:hypothetical protein